MEMRASSVPYQLTCTIRHLAPTLDGLKLCDTDGGMVL
jgi:hypothetical protein